MKYLKLTIYLSIFLALFALAQSANAATITSTSSGGNWSASWTWNGGVAPTATDDVVIATTGSSSVLLNVGSTAANVTINAGANLRNGTKQLTVTGDLTNNGKFTGNTGTTQMTGNSAQITGTGTQPAFYNLIINSAGTVTVNANIAVNNNLNITGTLSVASGKTVGQVQTNSPTLTINSSSYLSGSGTFDVYGTLWACAGGMGSVGITNNGTINIANFNYTYFSGWCGDATYSVNLPANITYGTDTNKTNVTFYAYNYVSVYFFGVTVNMLGDMTVKGDLTLSYSNDGYCDEGGCDAINFDLNQAGYNLNVGGNFSNGATNSPMDILGSGTITLNGSTQQTLSGDMTGTGTQPAFYNLIINSADTVTVNANITVNNNLNITGTLSVASNKTLKQMQTNSPTLTINSNSTLSGSGTFDVYGTLWACAGGMGSVGITNNGTINIANFNYTYFAGWCEGGVTYSVNLPANITYGDDTVKTNMTLYANTYQLSGTFDVTVNMLGNMTVKGDLTMSNSPDLGMGDLINFDLNQAGYNLNVGGNFSNGATNSPMDILGSGTITLNGSGQQTLSGNMTGIGVGSTSAFYNLTIANGSGGSAVFDADATVTNNYKVTTASDTVTYKSGSTYTFKNIEWNGQASGTKVTFKSSSSGSPWNLNVTGTQTAVSYVDVSDSNAGGGQIIYANNGTNNNGGNNTNWYFGSSAGSSFFRLGSNVFLRNFVYFRK